MFELTSDLRCLQRVTTPTGCTLLVNHISYGRVPTEDVLERRAVPESVVLTSDGRGYRTGEWHLGEEQGETVRVERWGRGGLEFHGYIDSVSRQLVQTG